MNNEQKAKEGRDLILQSFKDKMIANKLTINKTATIAGIAPSTLTRAFSGQTELNMLNMCKVCVALNVTPIFK